MRILTPYLLFVALTAFGQSAESIRSNPKIFTDALVGTFVLVKGGSFDMGGTELEREKPIHRVTLSDYYIGQTEVTQAQWKAVMGNNPSTFSGCEECPVERVGWDDVQIFLQKINSQRGGLMYRLPTEAEWEYAARGGAQSKGYTYAGSNNIDEVAWYDGNAGNQPHPVKGKKPNELGLYDMSGNVWEWCSDWYGSYTSGSQINPAGPRLGSERVIRGGPWLSDKRDSRVSRRGFISQRPYYIIGFRLVVTTVAASAQPIAPPFDPASPAEIYTDALVGTFVLVKGGSFDMGGTASVREQPIHSVTLSDYYIGQTEVTQAQWKAVMGSNPSIFGGCDACPVEQVSWDDIQTFLYLLNSKSGGLKYHLPTEAEWEYAARGGAQSKGYTYAGSNNIDDVAWYDGNAGNQTHPVKGKKPNELGLYDMTGNVLEWCNDWYGSYSFKSQTNPYGPDAGSFRVYRGGSWFQHPQHSHVSIRFDSAPKDRHYFVGFRLIRTVGN